MTCLNTKGHGNWPNTPTSFPLKNYDFQPSELLVLEMLRHYCQSYADPGSFSWEKAINLGEDELGAYDGAWVSSAVAGFIQSIRNNRRVSFEFIVSCCPTCRQQICVTELNALWLVQAARTENLIAMETAARLTLSNPLDTTGPQLLMAKASHLGSVLREVFPGERHHKYKATLPGHTGRLH